MKQLSSFVKYLFISVSLLGSLPAAAAEGPAIGVASVMFMIVASISSSSHTHVATTRTNHRAHATAPEQFGVLATQTVIQHEPLAVQPNPLRQPTIPVLTPNKTAARVMHHAKIKQHNSFCPKKTFSNRCMPKTGFKRKG